MDGFGKPSYKTTCDDSGKKLVSKDSTYFNG